MPAAEDVERQIAVAVVITVEKAPLLIAVQWVVGGVEVENDLRRRMLVRSDEQIDKRCFDRLWVVADLVIGVGWSGPNSSRLSVDWPATGAQFRRRAVSLPANTAMIGVWRSSS
jgi:hypothetical protein